MNYAFFISITYCKPNQTKPNQTKQSTSWFYAVAACGVSSGIYFYIQRQLGMHEGNDNGISGLASADSSALDDGDATGDITGSGGSFGGGASPGSGSGALSPKTDWRAGRRFMAARQSLLALKPGDMDFKYWRPFVLFLAKTDAEDGACELRPRK